MKTIEEFSKEIKGSEALKDELKAIKDKEDLEAFFKKYDCVFNASDFEASIASDL